MPAYLLSSESSLPKVTDAVKANQPLNVLVVGLLLVFFVVAAPDGVLGWVKKWKQSSK